jgi:hypothetical protein
MIKLSAGVKKQLIDLFNEKEIGIEGNILKLIELDDVDTEFNEYINTCIENDRQTRVKRLEITKKVQQQNTELTELDKENKKILKELKSTLESVEESKRKIVLQNQELIEGKEENERITKILQEEMDRTEQSKNEAENAKQIALNDLDVLQRKTQTELMGNIVKVALGVIMFISIVTTGMYVFSILIGKEVDKIGPAWTNMFGILLTNAFSIVGTIMGVKYATKELEKKS